MQLKKFAGVFNYTTLLSVVTQDNKELFRGTLGELQSYDFVNSGECHVKDAKLVDPSNSSEENACDDGKNAYIRIKIKLI